MPIKIESSQSDFGGIIEKVHSAVVTALTEAKRDIRRYDQENRDSASASQENKAVSQVKPK